MWEAHCSTQPITVVAGASVAVLTLACLRLVLLDLRVVFCVSSGVQFGCGGNVLCITMFVCVYIYIYMPI